MFEIKDVEYKGEYPSNLENAVNQQIKSLDKTISKFFKDCIEFEKLKWTSWKRVKKLSNQWKGGNKI